MAGDRTLTAEQQAELNQQLLKLLRARESFENTNEIGELFEEGADPNIRDEDGRTIFELAMEQLKDAPSERLLEIILGRGFNPDSLDQYGNPVLWMASPHMKLYFMEAGGTHVADEAGNPPLFFMYYDNSVRRMVKTGADVRQRNHAGKNCAEFLQKQQASGVAVGDHAIAEVKKYAELVKSLEGGTFDYIAWLKNEAAQGIKFGQTDNANVDSFLTAFEWLLHQPEAQRFLSKERLLSPESTEILKVHTNSSSSGLAPVVAMIMRVCAKWGEPIVLDDLRALVDEEDIGSPTKYLHIDYFIPGTGSNGLRGGGYAALKNVYCALTDEQRADFDESGWMGFTNADKLPPLAREWLGEECAGKTADEMQAALDSIPAPLRDRLPNMHQFNVALQRRKRAESPQQGRA